MNPCYIFITSLSANQVILAKYSHIIPIALSLFLAFFVFFKAKFNLFSKIFLFFVIVFSIWLIGDLITWSSYNYSLTYSAWSVLGFVEIIFYTLGLYFVLVFTSGKDISIFKKIQKYLSCISYFAKVFELNQKPAISISAFSSLKTNCTVTSPLSSFEYLAL